MTYFSEIQLFVLEKGEVVCHDFLELLGEYVDGELPPSLKERLEEHVTSCDVCTDFENTYRFVIEAAKLLRERRALPAGVSTRLREALNHRLGLNMPVSVEER